MSGTPFGLFWLTKLFKLFQRLSPNVKFEKFAAKFRKSVPQNVSISAHTTRVQFHKKWTKTVGGVAI